MCRPKPTFFHGKLKHPHFSSWQPKQVFEKLKVWCFPDQVVFVPKPKTKVKLHHKETSSFNLTVVLQKHSWLPFILVIGFCAITILRTHTYTCITTMNIKCHIGSTSTENLTIGDRPLSRDWQVETDRVLGLLGMTGGVKTKAIRSVTESAERSSIQRQSCGVKCFWITRQGLIDPGGLAEGCLMSKKTPKTQSPQVTCLHLPVQVMWLEEV